jgi:hypothetical protein
LIVVLEKCPTNIPTWARGIEIKLFRSGKICAVGHPKPKSRPDPVRRPDFSPVTDDEPELPLEKRLQTIDLISSKQKF